MKKPEAAARPRLSRRELMGMRWVWSLGGLSLKELSRRVYNELEADEVFDRAAQLSYYFLLSLFPLLLFLSAIAANVFSSQPDLSDRVLDYMRTVMPSISYQLVKATMHDLSTSAGTPALSIGLGLALWSGSVGMEAMIKGLNTAYDIREFRPWWKRRLLAIVMTVTLTILLLTALVLMLAGQEIGRWIANRTDLGSTFESFWPIGRTVAMIVFVLLAFNLIYLFAPNLREHRWQAIMPGALVAFGAWVAGSFGLKIYVDHFGNYAKTYGSLGAVIVLLLWLYLTGVAVLVGGEVNSEIRKAAAEAGAPAAQGPLEQSAG